LQSLGRGVEQRGGILVMISSANMIGTERWKEDFEFANGKSVMD
jgi:hypothetical protein